jgi:hypothetical protein
MSKFSKNKNIHRQILGSELNSKSLGMVATWLNDSYYSDIQLLVQHHMKYVYHSSNPMTGFSAIGAMKGSDLVLLFPGTDSLQDYVSNFMLALDTPTLQMRMDVEQFIERCLSEVVTKYNSLPHNVYCFGHSLGAVNSDTAAALMLKKGLLFNPDQIKSITIENPGSKKVISKFLNLHEIEEYSKCFSIYNNKENGINSTKEHITKPHIVQKPYPVKHHVSAIVAEHAVQTFDQPGISIIHNNHPDHKWEETMKLYSNISAISCETVSRVSDVTKGYINYYGILAFNAIDTFCGILGTMTHLEDMNYAELL